MSRPINPGGSAPEGTARRGTRQPGLIPAAPEALALAVTPDGDVHPEAYEGMAPEPTLLYPGAVVACSMTLAVDLGTGGTSFARIEARDLVQPEESHTDAYGRLVEFVRDGVISQVDDMEEHLEEREKELAERAKQLQ